MKLKQKLEAFRHSQKNRLARELKTFASFSIVASFIASIGYCMAGNQLLALGFFALSSGIGFVINPVGMTLALVAMSANTPVPRYQNYVDGITGVANSGTGTMKIPIDRRYHGLDFRCTVAGALANPTTVVDTIAIDVGGVEIIRMTAEQLLDEARMWGITPGTGELPVFFTQPWMRSNRQQEATSWDLFGQSSCTARITFLNPGGGAVGLTCLADYDLQRNVSFNPVTQRQEASLTIFKKYSITQGLVAGANNVTNIPTTRPIQRIICDVSANAISSVMINADSVKVMEATKAENDDQLGREGIDAGQNEYPIIFDKQRKISSSLVAQTLNLQVTTSGALTLTALIVQRCKDYLG